MKFARLQNNRVREVFEADSLVQFKKTFHKGIIDACVEVLDGQDPSEGDEYNPTTEVFSEYIKPPPTQAELNSVYENNANSMERELLKLALKWIDSKLDVQNPEDVIFRTKFNEIEAERNKVQ